MLLNSIFYKKIYRRQVERMDDIQYLRSLSWQGTEEDLADIIAYITSRCLITPDKLQGLLWFAYAWGLVILNAEIAPFLFVQTPYGPAELNVNENYPIWDHTIIPQGPAPRLNPQVEKLLDAVIKRYGSMSTDDLNRRYSLHCPGVPAGEEISARDVFLFFSAASYSETYKVVA